jgi:hypothetical protein
MSIRLCKAVAIVLAAAFAPLSAAWAEDARSGAQDGPAQVSVWKTISLGIPAGRYALFDALDAQGIHVGDAAQEVLHRPAFTVSRSSTDVQLARVSVAQLGFGQGATLAEIYRRAAGSGLELCPPEVAPLLRLQYRDQPPGQFLHVAMLPIATYSGEPFGLSLGNGGAGLVLAGFDGRPEAEMPPQAVFVFVHPERIALPGAPQHSP